MNFAKDRQADRRTSAKLFTSIRGSVILCGPRVDMQQDEVRHCPKVKGQPEGVKVITKDCSSTAASPRTGEGGRKMGKVMGRMGAASAGVEMCEWRRD